MKLTCNATGVSTYLTCKNNEWTGDFKNCSAGKYFVFYSLLNFVQTKYVCFVIIFSHSFAIELKSYNCKDTKQQFYYYIQKK